MKSHFLAHLVAFTIEFCLNLLLLGLDIVVQNFVLSIILDTCFFIVEKLLIDHSL